MNKEIFVIFALVTLATSSILFLFRRDKKELKDRLASFGTTIIGTFIGVFFAVYMNNLMTINHEKEQLKASLAAIETEIKKHSELPNAIDNPTRILEVLNSRTFDQPPLFINLFSNDLFFKYCSPATTSLLYLRDHILSTIRIMNNKGNSPQRRGTAFVWYRAHLNHVEDLLKVSVQLISGEIRRDDFDKIETQLEKKHYIKSAEEDK